MSRYTVVRLDEAQNGLAAIWMRATNRSAITAVAALVDQELSADPLSKGTEVHEGLFAFRRGPIQVLFSVREPDRIVEVAKVKSAPAEGI